LKDLIDELEIDTTPKKSMVQQVLGGPITFLGQYEDEDLVLVCRRPESLGEEVAWNPHKLQPPFENTEVQGDILIMRVKKEEEKLEHDEADGSDKPISDGTDDFFLDFTKEDYIQFALRDDVEPPEFEEQEVEEQEEEELEEEDDEEILGEDDDDDDEDDDDNQVGMMNLIMAQVLRRFNEENGRGPNTQELLELRSALAHKLGVELPEVAGAGDEADESDAKPSATEKRAADNEAGDAGDEHEAKRVKFSQEATEAEETEEAGKAGDR
jgi:hypothetical protein